MKLLEAWLHRLGYRYTGPGSLYGVTFYEINDLTQGQHILQLTADGVTKGEEAMFNKLSEELG